MHVFDKINSLSQPRKSFSTSFYQSRKFVIAGSKKITQIKKTSREYEVINFLVVIFCVKNNADFGFGENLGVKIAFLRIIYFVFIGM